jgi:hypothetical protein
MGQLGWSPSETDAMELWQIGMFLGPDGGDPVIRGARQLTVKSDTDKPAAGLHPTADRSVAARIAAHKARQQQAEQESM